MMALSVCLLSHKPRAGTAGSLHAWCSCHPELRVFDKIQKVFWLKHWHQQKVHVYGFQDRLHVRFEAESR